MYGQNKTLIVGGGIWGLSTAYHLARAGETDVLVLERGEDTAGETTSQAAGLVGQFRSTPLMRRAIRYAIDLFTSFEKETGHDPGFRQVGSLLLALTHERMVSYVDHVEHANRNGVEARFVDASEMRCLCPHIEPDHVEGGYFVSGDGYVDPKRCARAFRAAAEDLGVEIRVEIEVTGLSIRDGRATGAMTDHGFVEAEKVVVTAGPWTALLAKTVGVEMAVAPIRHQRVTTSPVLGIPDYHPVVRVTDASCYLRPERGGFLHGFFEPYPVTHDLEASRTFFRTRDVETSIMLIADSYERLVPVFPVLENAGVIQVKRGLTTFAPDGAYLVGPAPGIEDLFLATGCASLGIAGSAAIGRWLSNWITKGDPGEELSAVSPGRFGARSANREWARRESEKFYADYYSISSMDVG